jgi:hypothetical protein
MAITTSNSIKVNPRSLSNIMHSYRHFAGYGGTDQHNC